MKSIVKCLTKSKKILTLSLNEHVFWKTIGELNLIRCLMLPLIIKRYSEWGHLFFGIENYMSKNIRFHILVVE
jgi:hypothetical protein